MRTAIVPWFRPEATECFMDRSNAPEVYVAVGEFDVLTRPLKVGRKIDLIEISTCDELLLHAKLNLTDRVYPEKLVITALYDVNARGEIITRKLTPEEGRFVQEGELWCMSIETKIAGLASSFRATFNPANNLLDTCGSLWGFSLTGVRGN